MSHFKTTRHGIAASFTHAEREFLSDVPRLLASLGDVGDDPAATRLKVPVYLDDPDSNEEWWRLMGEELRETRLADRATFERVVGSEEAVTLTVDEANSFLRVLNESRLALGARFGVEVEGDHDRLEEPQRHVLDYLGWVLEELTAELTRGL